MSDSRLQDLERAWRASGAADDEAATLRARVRVGDLPRRRLELAAYCGHPGAREACSWTETVPVRATALGKTLIRRFGKDATLAAVDCLGAALSTRPAPPTQLEEARALTRRARQDPRFVVPAFGAWSSVVGLDLNLRSLPTPDDLCRLVVQHVERLPDRRELTRDVLQALAAWALEV